MRPKKKTVKKQYKNGSSLNRLKATKLTCEVKKPKDFVSRKNQKIQSLRIERDKRENQNFGW